MKKRVLYPKGFKDIKGPVAIAELRRAHMIIAILCAAFAYIVILQMAFPLIFDKFFGSVIVALLLIVAASSIASMVGLKRKR